MRVSKIIGVPNATISFRSELALQDMRFGDSYPVRESAFAEGVIRNTAGVLLLTATISAKLCGACDRCAAQFERDVSFPVEAVLVTELEDEHAADAWTFLIKDDCVDLDEILTTAFVLNMDSKQLCKPECKGLCGICGKNLNEGDCDCRPEPDPRWAVLGQLFKDK